MLMFRLALREFIAARWLMPILLMFNVAYLFMEAGQIELFLLTTMVFSMMYACLGVVIEVRSRTEATWCSLPVGRPRLVRSRYLSCTLGVLLGLATSAIVGQIIASRSLERRAPLPGLAYLDLLVYLLILFALYLPMHFAWGPGKGFGYFSAGMMVLVVGVGLISELIVWIAGTSNPFLDPRLWQSLGGSRSGGIDIPLRVVTFIRTAVYLVAVTVTLVSLRLSEQLFAKRDL